MLIILIPWFTILNPAEAFCPHLLCHSSISEGENVIVTVLYVCDTPVFANVLIFLTLTLGQF